MVATKRNVTKAKAAQNGSPSPITRIRRTFRIECDWVDPLPGEDKLWAEIASLSFDEIDRVKACLRADVPFSETWAVISPYVVRWNAQAIDQLTGDLVDVPPPAEIGGDAFSALEPWVTTWLTVQLARVQFTPDFLGGLVRTTAGSTKPSDSPSGNAAAS